MPTENPFFLASKEEIKRNREENKRYVETGKYVIEKKEIFHCSRCNQEFKPTKPYQITCSELCNLEDEIEKQKIEDRIYWGKCKYCGKDFRKTTYRSSKTQCADCKREKDKGYVKIDEIDRWVKAKKRKGISLEELIRRMEWKRVWDDEGWNHYLSGKKYDKI